MAMMPRMEMRQGQSLVMTPQLLQAIKLLQLSHLELNSFVEAELERNPLLERDADLTEAPLVAEAGIDRDLSTASAEGEWFEGEASNALELERGGLDNGSDNVFSDDASSMPQRTEASFAEALPVTGGAYSGSGGSFDGDSEGFESTLTSELSLHEHLEAQLDLAIAEPVDRLIGRFLIDSIDDAGYLGVALPEIAERLNVAASRVERILATIQTFEPSGIAARDLAECLAIQLKERNRFDPAMAALIANLPLLARRDLNALRRLCGVDAEDLAEMIGEIKALDPKPGRAFGGTAVETVVPDIFIRAAPDGSWLVDLNPETLPRVLVNQTYHARVTKVARSDIDKAFIAECLQTANWLTRSLEQRARTILKVASEITRHQDGFFAYGVEHLRPLNLKTIADAISMHESTVSRVTSNKYIACSRGVFEMKYFFTASINSTGYGEAHSAEAVRWRIKQLIDGEGAHDILSDDALVTKLKGSGIDIARRTVAKYRESLRIPSSMERRRDKSAERTSEL
jgi:RNA polymerase sigma-54 factor